MHTLIGRVVESCSRQDFEYREWFVAYHLRMVEDLALKFVTAYPEADRNLVHALVWVHDYSKPFAKTKEEEKITLIPMVRDVLVDIGFENSFVDRVVAGLIEIESKDDVSLENASIEAKIISSADGASHFFGPFFFSYFRDSTDESITDTMQRIAQKAQRDWNRKIVLLEGRELVKPRYEILLDNMRMRE